MQVGSEALFLIGFYDILTKNGRNSVLINREDEVYGGRKGKTFTKEI